MVLAAGAGVQQKGWAHTMIGSLLEYDCWCGLCNFTQPCMTAVPVKVPKA